MCRRVKLSSAEKFGVILWPPISILWLYTKHGRSLLLHFFFFFFFFELTQTGLVYIFQCGILLVTYMFHAFNMEASYYSIKESMSSTRWLIHITSHNSSNLQLIRTFISKKNLKGAWVTCVMLYLSFCQFARSATLSLVRAPFKKCSVKSFSKFWSICSHSFFGYFFSNNRTLLFSYSIRWKTQKRPRLFWQKKLYANCISKGVTLTFSCAIMRRNSLENNACTFVRIDMVCDWAIYVYSEKFRWCMNRVGFWLRIKFRLL